MNLEEIQETKDELDRMEDRLRMLLENSKIMELDADTDFLEDLANKITVISDHGDGLVGFKDEIQPILNSLSDYLEENY